MMKIRTLISLAPTPLFALGCIWEVATSPVVCGNTWSMPLMWAIMAMAHLPSWWVWWDQRTLARYRLHRPLKQQ